MWKFSFNLVGIRLENGSDLVKRSLFNKGCLYVEARSITDLVLKRVKESQPALDAGQPVLTCITHSGRTRRRKKGKGEKKKKQREKTEGAKCRILKCRRRPTIRGGTQVSSFAGTRPQWTSEKSETRIKIPCLRVQTPNTSQKTTPPTPMTKQWRN